MLKGQSLADVANYADDIKSDETHDNWSNWHYKNFNGGLNKTQLMAQAFTQDDGQALYRIQWLCDTLKANPNNPEALSMLVHLVGDSHQPMHMGRKADLGGNRIPFYWFYKKTNLHHVWDSSLLESLQLSASELADKLDRTYTFDKKEVYSHQLILDWAWDTYRISEDIYNHVPEKKESSYHYIYKYVPVAEKQIAEAGFHLACILNYIYG